MSRIIRAGEKVKLVEYELERFSSTKIGEQIYTMHRFEADACSVQDKQGCDFEEEKAPTTGSKRVFANNMVSEEDDDFSDDAISNVKADDPDFIEENPLENVAVIHTEEEFNNIKKECADLKTALDLANFENISLKEQIEKLTASNIVDKEKAKQEGVQAGKAEAEATAKKQYDAEKSDYLANLEKFSTDALSELTKLNDTLTALDDQMPEIVIAYVKQIIGVERKLNDGIIANVIKLALERLKDVQNIAFIVNPEDAVILTEKFPKYGVVLDNTMPKGAVKIRTKIGEIDLSINSWVESLEKQINEQFSTAKNN